MIRIVLAVLLFSFALNGLEAQPEKELKKKKDAEALAEDPNDDGGEEKVPDIDEKPVVFVNANILNIRANPNTISKKRTLVYKSDPLTVLGATVDKNGKQWINISCLKHGKEYIGWVMKEFTVESRAILMNPIYKNLDYSRQDKTEYENNPKVKVKGIYLTRYSSTKARINKYFRQVKGTEINAFVIDIKNIRGNLLFKSEAAAKHNPAANKSVMYKGDSISTLIEKAKKNNIYLIGRIVVFKDDLYAKYHPETAVMDNATGEIYLDRDKLRWVSPHNRKYWEYLVDLCKEAADIGFNEIQFDYIRFPDWKKTLNFKNKKGESKALTIQRFLKYAYAELKKKEVYVSADLFGLVSSASDGLNLGQYWEGISNVVDYVSPMIYPSHYAKGFGTIPVPDADPYTTVFISARDGVARNRNLITPAIIRPWIQDFTAFWVKGHINYGRKQVLDQIKALKDTGVDEYLLWNPKNRYKNLK